MESDELAKVFEARGRLGARVFLQRDEVAGRVEHVEEGVARGHARRRRLDADEQLTHGAELPERRSTEVC